MSDLIDRQAAIEAVLHHGGIENNYTDLYHDGYCDGVYDSADILKELPSAQPKKGRWMDEHFADDYLANCSECGYEMNVRANHGYFNYCPNCGARMEGEDNAAD